MDFIIKNVVVSLAAGLGLSLVFTPLTRWLARKIGIIDQPGPRKIHSTPTPRLGGLAIYLAFFISAFLCLKFDHQLMAILISSSLLLVVSIVDDKWPVPAFIRFFIHIVAVVILLYKGIQIELIEIPYISFPIAVLWIVGVCNAFNAMDSADGLLGGMTVIYCIIFAVISFFYKQYFVTVCCAALAGATLGFLRYNFKKASIFLGDNGSTFLGFVIAALILRGIGPKNIVVPVLIIGLPIYDIILVHLRRYLAGTRNLVELLASTGKDHLFHRLASSGLSRQKAVFVIYFYTIVTAVIALLFIKPNVVQQVITLIIIGLMIFYAETLTVQPEEKLSTIHHSKPDIWEDEIDEVSKTLRSGFISQGERVLDFEAQMGRFTGRKYSVAVNNGTAAIHLALIALGVGEDDEVILPSYVCTAVLNPVKYLRAVPVLVDAKQDCFNMCVEGVKAALSSRTKAVIVPHLFGCPASIDRIIDLGVPVIEDCAQAIGGTYKGREIGSYGAISICSFYATKMMTTGQGGMLLTDDEELFRTILDLREYDNRSDYKPRYNYMLTDIQAALGLPQLERLPEFVRSRRIIARKYNTSFSSLGLTLPAANSNNENVFFRYIAIADGDRDDVMAQYHHLGIDVKKPVFKPLHRYLDLDPALFPRAEVLEKQAFSIPIYPSLSGKDIERIVEATGEIFTA